MRAIGSNPAIGVCEPGDEPRLVTFYRKLRGKESTPEFWRWKYFQNPAGGATVVAALEGEEIIGRLGALPVRARLGGAEVLAAQQVDAEILAESRRGGVYFEMAEVIREEGLRRGIAFGYGFATQETTALSTEMLGFSMVGPVGRLVKVLDYGHYLKPMLGGMAAGVIGKVVGARRSGTGRGRIRVVPVERFDARFDELAERPDLGPNRMIRDAAHLNWRYVDCPTTSYLGLAAEGPDGLRGFVVLHTHMEEGALRGVLDELVCPAEDGEVLEALLAAATGHLTREGAVNLVCWLPGPHGLGQRLRDHGFRERDARTYFIIVPGEHPALRMDELTDERNWFYTLGDSDYHLQAGDPARQEAIGE